MCKGEPGDGRGPGVLLLVLPRPAVLGANGGWCKEEKEITDLFLSLFDRELGLGPEQGFW